ncbi:T9SS type A sorting domain-containing protein [candidate division TA06 bacterium]|uniref:T9SS type A sorting domain-containing protein n=1 Tax=candidate division TA06 bacterium TaxID=2250710 RepID=A0A523XL46_UNCT6|nr:MAG: T9SS type A sorting domain-containing protein [candidate division TA06 bacterium]
MPYYIIPPEHSITLNPGDSLVENFIIYRADTSIVGRVTIADTVPLDTFHFMIAECETSGVGMAMTLCDSATGLYELGVNSADTLTWRVAIDPPFGDRIPGYVVENGFVRTGFSGGDTVNFNFVPATDTIGGTISFHPNVPGSLQFPLDTLSLLLFNLDDPFFPPQNVSGFTNPDPSGVYWFPSEPDTYGIYIIDLPDTNYYTVPPYYDSLIIAGDTDTLDFVVYHSSVGVQEEVMGKSRFGGARLYACSPNPFVGRTVIEAYIPPGGEYKSSQVSVYDVTGRLVNVLSKGEHGSVRLHWDGKSSQGRDVSAGIYFVRLEASGVSITRKAVLLR